MRQFVGMVVALLGLAGAAAPAAVATPPGTPGLIVYAYAPYDARSNEPDRTRSSHLRTVRANGKGDRPLTKGTGRDFAPTISPDGRRVAFIRVARGGGPSSLQVINVDGTGLVRIRSSAEYLTTPAWSPDGTRIAVASIDGGVRVLDIADGTERRIDPPAGFAYEEPAWSADGASLILVRGTWDAAQYGFTSTALWTVPVEGAAAALLGGSGALRYVRNPDVAPDGTGIVFRAFDRTAKRRALHLVGVDGRGARVLATARGKAVFGPPAFAPDGTRVLAAEQYATGPLGIGGGTDARRGSRLLTIDVKTRRQVTVLKRARGLIHDPVWQALS